eukprot:3188583-Amphidinium_carterae.1
MERNGSILGCKLYACTGHCYTAGNARVPVVDPSHIAACHSANYLKRPVVRNTPQGAPPEMELALQENAVQ